MGIVDMLFYGLVSKPVVGTGSDKHTPKGKASRSIVEIAIFPIVVLGQGHFGVIYGF